MHYSYEFKLMCIELYRQGLWPETPDGIKAHSFRSTIKDWVKIADEVGSDALKHPVQNKKWTPDEKLELVLKVSTGESIRSIAHSEGINNGTLYRWVQRYETMGYNGLVNKKKGRPPKAKPMKKKRNVDSSIPLNESEREELIRLREENKYIKAENEVIKKSIALRKEKQAALLKAKKQQSSKNSEKKDTD